MTLFIAPFSSGRESPRQTISTSLVERGAWRIVQPTGECASAHAMISRNCAGAAASAPIFTFVRKLSSPAETRSSSPSSLLRPKGLMEGAEDEAIAQVIRWQETFGLKVVTDGEFRRESWRLGFVAKVQGFALANASGEVDLQEAKLKLVVETATDMWGQS